MKERLKPYNKLRAYWSKKENDLMYWHPKRKVDSRLLNYFFDCAKLNTGGGETSLLEELDRRGFDLSTLRFSIAYKDNEN